ncbi:MAG TPA: hypothetical protein VFR70_06435 [Flavobacterium sp.]|nr:hypothetical protein [Flavobacterium sp.]
MQLYLALLMAIQNYEYIIESLTAGKRAIIIAQTEFLLREPVLKGNNLIVVYQQSFYISQMKKQQMHGSLFYFSNLFCLWKQERDCYVAA